MNFSEEQCAILSLSLLPDIGPRRYQSLVNYFGTAKNVLSASINDFASIENIPENAARRINADIKKVNPDDELELAKKEGARVITCIDGDYPSWLKDISDYPPVIYVRGEILLSDAMSVAVVGTRHPTSYGKNVAEKFSVQLAQRHITIVSGLARGIDTQAHGSSLEHGGRTIAVLGNGLMFHYPPENRALEEKIARNGAVVSEFPMRTRPDKMHFPRRNRIIAGLSLATLVVEADIKSGALITAKIALDQGKDVFAVPGPIFSNYSKGPHFLIKSGAQVAESADDIIDALNQLSDWVRKNKSIPPADLKEVQLADGPQKKIISFIEAETGGVSVDELILRSGSAPQNLAKELLELELKGLVRSLPGKIYVRNY